MTKVTNCPEMKGSLYSFKNTDEAVMQRGAGKETSNDV